MAVLTEIEPWLRNRTEPVTQDAGEIVAFKDRYIRREQQALEDSVSDIAIITFEHPNGQYILVTHTNKESTLNATQLFCQLVRQTQPDTVLVTSPYTPLLNVIRRKDGNTAAFDPNIPQCQDIVVPIDNGIIAQASGIEKSIAIADLMNRSGTDFWLRNGSLFLDPKGIRRIATQYDIPYEQAISILMEVKIQNQKAGGAVTEYGRHMQDARMQLLQDMSLAISHYMLKRQNVEGNILALVPQSLVDVFDPQFVPAQWVNFTSKEYEYIADSVENFLHTLIDEPVGLVGSKAEQRQVVHTMVDTIASNIAAVNPDFEKYDISNRRAQDLLHCGFQQFLDADWLSETKPFIKEVSKIAGLPYGVDIKVLYNRVQNKKIERKERRLAARRTYEKGEIFRKNENAARENARRLKNRQKLKSQFTVIIGENESA